MARKDRADVKGKGVTSLKEARDTTTGQRREIRMTLQERDNLENMVETLQGMMPNKRVTLNGVVRAFSYLFEDGPTLNKVSRCFKDNL